MTMEIDLTAERAMEQAGHTAEYYYSRACKILGESEDHEVNPLHAIELAKVMAQDFHTVSNSAKLQDIRDAIHELSSAIDRMTENP